MFGDLLIFLAIGLLAGWLASIALRSRDLGWRTTLGAGVLGAVVGGLLPMLGLALGISGVVLSALGAVAVLFAAAFLSRRSKRARTPEARAEVRGEYAKMREEQGPERSEPISARGEPVSVRSEPVSVRSEPVSVRSEPMSLRDQVAEWLEGVRIEASKLQRDLENHAAHTRNEVKAGLANLERKMSSARERINGLGDRESDAWDELKRGVTDAWETLKSAGKRALEAAKREKRESSREAER